MDPGRAGQPAYPAPRRRLPRWYLRRQRVSIDTLPQPSKGSLRMPKTLVVVESPAKAKTIEKYLGGDYTVRASYGHIRDLPKSQLGVDVEHDFEPEYMVPEESERHVRELKSAHKKADDLVLATDYDREGEAIAFHVATILGVSPDVAKRVTFTEITKDAILEAFREPREIDMKLVDAQQARRVLDRLVGYRISPLLWKRVRPGLSAGRVQSVAVRLIVEREREILAFIPIEYWSVDVRLTPDGDPQPFLARLVEVPRGQARGLARQEGRAPGRRARRRPARRAPEPRRLPRHERGAQGAQALAGAAVHHVDAAAGGRAQARVLGAQDHDARPAPVRGRRPPGRGHGRPHHLHADRLAEHRRHGAPRDRRAGEGHVRSDLRARRAAALQDEVAQRAGGARGHPSDVRAPHARADEPGPRSRPAAAVPPDLAAHGRVADGRGPLQPGVGRHRGARARTRPATSATGCAPPARRSCSTGSSASTTRGATTRPTRTPSPRCRSSPPSRCCACSRSCPSSTSPSRRRASPRRRW